jgi:hypothetical protein
MPRKRKASRREPRGAQKWILTELRSLRPGALLSTSDLANRIRQAAGKAFHKNSVYNALRLLSRRGDIRAVRKGHEKAYALRSAGGLEVTAGPPQPEAPLAVAPRNGAPGPTFPHRLGLGEILVLSVEGGYVLAATNEHGRLVFGRYRVPR